MAELREVAFAFLRLGLIGFGGPLAHIALMRDELVRRRGWLNDATFLDLVGVTNLLPGPNSTEMAIHLGHRRAGWPGLLVAGLAFIVPPALIVLALAWLYVAEGATPPLQGLLWGIKPMVIAIVVFAGVGLGRRAVRDPWTVLVAFGAAGGYLLGANELLLLALGAVAVPAGRRIVPGRGPLRALLVLPAATVPAAAAASVSLGGLALVFLKVGALLYGSGYVLLAFLRADLVERLGWLTDRQLLDAVAIGQLTPGPVFTTATFVGYLLAGLPGAVVATVAIFLPAFVFVAAVGPITREIRRRAWTAALLDGVTAASLGLMAGVAVLLARDGAGEAATLALALLGLLGLANGRVGPTRLVVLGALAGLLRLGLGGGA